MTTNVETDVLVVGAGVVGASATYELALRGRAVTLCDAGDAGSGASGRSAGFVVLVPFRDSAMGALTRLNRTTLARYMADVGDFNLKPGGIWLVGSPDVVPAVKDYVEEQRRSGLAVEFLDSAEVRGLVPVVSDAISGAAYCADEASIDPALLIERLTDAAVSVGAKLALNEPVREILIEGGRVAGVRTAQRIIRAQSVVIAAGVGAKALLATANVKAEITPIRTDMIVTAPLVPCVETFVYGPRAFYKYGMLGHLSSYTAEVEAAARGEVAMIEADLVDAFVQTADGSIFAGATSVEGDDDDSGQPLDQLAILTTTLARSYPALGKVRIRSIYTALSDAAPNGEPMLGSTRVPGLFVAAAMGPGISTGPAAGMLIAQLVTGEMPSMPIARFSIDR